MDSIVAFFAGLFAAVFPGFVDEEDLSLSGYVEAEYVYIASTTSGRIEEIAVQEQQAVSVGDLLFRLDDAQQIAGLAVAQAMASAAQAKADNITTGAREEELEVVRAQLAMALANQKQLTNDLERDQKLMSAGVVADVKVEQVTVALASANAQVEQLEAQIVSMQLPARSAELLSAEANVQAALAEVSSAKTRLESQSIVSPISGTIDSIFYSVGEVSSAGSPTISILPDGPKLAIFFIPEPRLSEFSKGTTVSVNCDGCPEGITASIESIDSQPEFTPPIIYSRDERSRLVFRAEARLGSDTNLNPGQPVSIEIIK